MQDKWLEWIVSACGGVLVSLVAFRTRLALMDRNRREDLRRISRLARRVDMIDKRTYTLLSLTGAIARRVGVTERFDDALARFLTESHSEHDAEHNADGAQDDETKE